MRSVVIHFTDQIFMVSYSIISQNTHKMRKISNFHTFEILGHPIVETIKKAMAVCPSFLDGVGIFPSGSWLRGGVTKKNGKIWDKIPIRLDPPPLR